MKNRTAHLQIKPLEIDVKTSFTLISLILLSLLLSKKANARGGTYESLKSNSKVKSVTIFLDGAQVEREGFFLLEPGSNELVFRKVSPHINPQSIQVKGKGSFTILDVRHHIHHPIPQATSNEIPDHIKRKIELIKDSLQLIDFELEENSLKIGALDLEKKILLGNDLYNGKSDKSDSIPILKEGMLYLRKQLSDINTQLFILNKKSHYSRKEKDAMRLRLNAFENYQRHQPPKIKEAPEHQIIVTVSSNSTSRASLNANYLVRNAGWTAHYDLRAENTSSPVKLTYKAKVYQNTGEDWERVRLKLSTNNPNRSNVKPQLPIWYIYYHQRKSIGISNYKENLSNVAMEPQSMDKIGRKREELELQDANTSGDFTKVSQNIVSAEFDIDLPYSIKSNGHEHLVEVQSKNLPATYYHTVVPKMDREAYVISKITDWEQLNLLPASASIFFDGTFIGNTYINPIQLDDTLSVAMGRDPMVYVQRKKSKENIKVQTIGNNRIQSMAFEIIVKNRNAAPIKLIVEDQIPVSRTDEIKVNPIDLGNAEHNEVFGSLSWNATIPKGSEKKFNFSYSIKYDKNKPLLGAL